MPAGEDRHLLTAYRRRYAAGRFLACGNPCFSPQSLRRDRLPTAVQPYSPVNVTVHTSSADFISPGRHQ